MPGRHLVLVSERKPKEKEKTKTGGLLELWESAVCFFDGVNFAVSCGVTVFHVVSSALIASYSLSLLALL